MTMPGRHRVRDISLYLNRLIRPDAKRLEASILDRLFRIEAESAVEFTPSPAFTPGVWAGIERQRLARSSWAYYLVAWFPRLAFATMALAGAVVLSHWMTVGPDSGAVALEASYEDVLIHNAMDQNDGAIYLLAENGE